jgi:hypothetical protein
MAYVAITLRGGTEEQRDRVREALASQFEDAWGEIDVELTYDGARWSVDSASWRVSGASQRRDCRDQVATALSLARIAIRGAVDPSSPPATTRPKLW